MKPVRTYAFRLAAALLPLAVLAACLRPVSPEDPYTVSDDGQSVLSQVSLALRSRSGSPSTKMLDAVTQINGNSDHTVFRGIEKVYIIPFGTQGLISASDERQGNNLELPQDGIAATWGASAADGNLEGLVLNNNSHLYKDVYVTKGTSSVLVYGKAIDVQVSATPSDSVDFKRRNGVLRAHGTESAGTPADISFTLEPFVRATQQAQIDSKLNLLFTYLNNIAAATVTATGRTSRYGSQTSWTYTWSNPSSFNNFQTLINSFETLTGSGLVFSGSTKALEQMLTGVYNGLYDIANSTSNSTSYRLQYYPGASGNNQTYYYYAYELAREIRSRIANTTYVNTSGSGNSVTVSFNSDLAGFPSSFGVPEGAVAIQWNGSEFATVSAASSTLAPIESYCYPPSLWYWTNSTVKTSSSQTVSSQYTSANASWSDILSNYTLGSTVRPGVVSTAIEKPLQYGVAQLRLRFNPVGTNVLLDSQANSVSVNNSNFPFTGIIIGEQRDLYFNFKPSSGNSYIYDSDVYDGNSPKAWIAYSGAGLTFQPVHTLVLQTNDGEDVHYALEFINNSGASFKGVNGSVVAQGSRFYLAGTLSVANGTNTTGETLNSVFVQDHVTEVVVTVNGLAKAYNTIPELRDPQLEIGVQTEMKWVGSTPASIPMY